MINFGKYDQKVIFVTWGSEPDGYGGTVPIESLVLETFASVKQINGGSSNEQGQMLFPNIFQVRVQMRDGFTPTTAMMVKYRGVFYKISGVVREYQRLSQEWVITIVGGEEMENGNVS